MIEFGQPAAFWTGLAVGLPILAHMAYRRITDRHKFPSLRFITPSQIPRTGRKTPTDRALLCLRILLFLAIMFLLADPYWSVPVNPEQSSRKSETLIAIDLSPSMGGWNSLAEAKNAASQIIEQENSEMGLLTFGRNSIEEWPIGTPTDQLVDTISKLDHGWKRGDAQVLIDRVGRLFEVNTAAKKVVIISDFQKGDWQSVNFDLSEKGIDVEMIRVGAGVDPQFRSNNQSIMDVKVVPSGPSKVRIWSVIRNWSAQKSSGNLELVVGGEVQETQVIEVPALSSRQVQFIVPTSDVSQAQLRLVNEDSLLLDNLRSVWLKAPPPKHFGFWHEDGLDESTRSEMNFLKTAVESAGDNGWNRWQESQENADGLRMVYEDSKLELLLILGLGEWFENQGLADSLNKYLENGGVVVITPGEIFSETATIIRNAEWFKFSFIRVAGGAAAARNPFRIGALEEDSKLASTFAGKSVRDLYLTSFRKFGILQQIEDSVAIALRDREGRALVLSKSLSSGGRIVFFPFRMNTYWSDLPLRTSFLPLLMELVRKEKRKDQTLPLLEPGEQYGKREQPFLAQRPGVFRHAGRWLEVVFPSAESITDTLSDQELNNRLGLRVNLPAEEKAEVGALADKDRNSLWMWFAILVATLLTIEMLWSRPLPSSQDSKGVSHA